MRKMTRLLTILAVAGAFAPLAANASSVGTSMYAPSPLIVHAQPQHKAVNANGRTAHAQQMQAIARNG
ncbi:hypothetical protein AruPA_06985 [Acidiphilium sp. PA]|uniref:hypothetical protein n=1 Tax=Acidiphilium sp. PA TaxID=2871705 RepID=UPI002244C020|nr:hypothetical protein [Acidiphilium sp. PA]MCW8306776.1 hypothetical protein [Acidiphilium sp. PA]